MSIFPPISRDDVLAGRVRFDRRPAQVLAAIEARCSYMLRESRRAIEAYLLHDDGDFRREYLWATSTSSSCEEIERWRSERAATTGRARARPSTRPRVQWHVRRRG